jgi:hypothetical protein
MRIKRVAALPKGAAEDLSTDENGIKNQLNLKLTLNLTWALFSYHQPMIGSCYELSCLYAVDPA